MKPLDLIVSDENFSLAIGEKSSDALRMHYNMLEVLRHEYGRNTGLVIRDFLSNYG